VTVVQGTVPPEPVVVHIEGVRGGPPRGTVLRRDNWRLQPIAVVVGLTGFVAYTIWTIVRNGDFYTAAVGRDYLSPFYSPCLTDVCAKNGYVWGDWTWWRASPAILAVIIPGAFRATCYYYRKSYYRSYWLSPPACAVADAGSTRPGGPRSRYSGETRFPLILQNAHRYAWYLVLGVAGVLTWDAIAAFRFPNGIGMGLGTLVLLLNAVFIWAYTLGCHSCRHLCGGNLKRFSKAPVRYWLWKNVFSQLNAHHQLWAWVSMIWVAVADFYVWLVASGTIHDPRFF
jgi:hypothetical protein